MPIDWANVETVEIPLPPAPPPAHCPRCGGTGHTIIRTMGDQGDGSVLRRVLCHCGEPFQIVLDPSLYAPCQRWQSELDTPVK